MCYTKTIFLRFRKHSLFSFLIFSSNYENLNWTVVKIIYKCKIKGFIYTCIQLHINLCKLNYENRFFISFLTIPLFKSQYCVEKLT